MRGWLAGRGGGVPAVALTPSPPYPPRRPRRKRPSSVTLACQFVVKEGDGGEICGFLLLLLFLREAGIMVVQITLRGNL